MGQGAEEAVFPLVVAGIEGVESRKRDDGGSGRGSSEAVATPAPCGCKADAHRRRGHQRLRQDSLVAIAFRAVGDSIDSQL